MNHGDVGVVQRGQRARLATEVFKALRVLAELEGKSLDGHVTTELVVVSKVDLSHASPPEKRSNLVLAQIHAFTERSFQLLPKQGAGMRQHAAVQRTVAG